jgi:NitT/TauT family transport system substrate-binding protein
MEMGHDSMTLTRRCLVQTGIGAAVSVVAAPRVARASVRTVRFGNAAGLVDPLLVFMTVGQHPRLGYFAAEEVTVDYVNMAGSAQSLQAVGTGAVHFATVTPVSFMPVVAKNPRLQVVSCYSFLRQPQWLIAVDPSSSITDLNGLKGKRLGIRNPSDTGLFGARGNLSAVGIDPDRDVEWISIGSGGPAGDALARGKIDALASWDGELARIEAAGFKLRYIPNPPAAAQLFGSTFGVNPMHLDGERGMLVGLFRAIAKSTVFAATNPRAAIRLHWDLFPESKPKGLDDNKALESARFIVERRRPLWFPASPSDDHRLGAQSLEQWQSMASFTSVANQIPDINRLFTNVLIDDVNRFDRSAIEAQASNWKSD